MGCVACLFVCTVIQRIARSPQLCHSMLSNAKQEINVARCLFSCACVCASPDTSSCQCFSFGCVCVWGRGGGRDVSAHRPKAELCQRKQGSAILLSLCCISKSMSLLSLAVKPISPACYAPTKPQPASKPPLAAASIHFNAGLLIHFFFGVHKLLSCVAQQEKKNSFQRGQVVRYCSS